MTDTDTNAQLKRLADLMNTQEDLDPELEEYYEDEGPMGFSCIRHPLVYSILHSPNQNAMVNAQLKAKQKALSKAFLEKQWSSYIFLHERPYRLDAFMAVCGKFTDEEYWHLLGSIWTDSENIRQNEMDWRLAMTSDRPGRDGMMDAEERAVLYEDLESEVEVHRGFCHPGRERGMSWTKNPVVAKFFARRLAQPGQTKYLATGRVRREHILVYFTGRSEEEIVVLPENVRDLTIIELTSE